MRPIGREGGDGSAQRGRSMISTIALLYFAAVLETNYGESLSITVHLLHT